MTYLLLLTSCILPRSSLSFLWHNYVRMLLVMWRISREPIDHVKLFHAAYLQRSIIRISLLPIKYLLLFNFGFEFLGFTNQRIKYFI
jgi:hypothetical protein